MNAVCTILPGLVDVLYRHSVKTFLDRFTLIQLWIIPKFRRNFLIDVQIISQKLLTWQDFGASIVIKFEHVQHIFVFDYRGAAVTRFDFQIVP